MIQTAQPSRSNRPRSDQPPSNSTTATTMTVLSAAVIVAIWPLITAAKMSYSAPPELLRHQVNAHFPATRRTAHQQCQHNLKHASATAGNLSIALTREIRGIVYNFHMRNLTGKHISGPKYLGPMPLHMTALHFAGSGYAGAGLEND